MIQRMKSIFAIPRYPVLFLCMLLIGIGVSITTPYLALYFTEELGMSATAFGIFMAASSLSGVLVNTGLARHSDNGLNRKWLILAAAVGSMLAYLAYMTIHQYVLLLLLVSLLTGIGAIAVPQVYASAQEAADASGSTDKPFAMSALRTLISVGFLTGPLAGTFVLTGYGYQGLFAATAGLYAVLAAFVLLFVHRAEPAVPAAARTSRASMPSFRSKAFREPFLAFVLLFMANAFNTVHTPLFMVNEIGGTHADVGRMVSLCAGLEIPILLVLGALGRHISSPLLLRVGCLVGMLYGIVLASAGEVWQVMAAQVLQAIFVAIVMGNGLSYFMEWFPGSPGIAAAIYANASTLGRLLGNMGSGFAAEQLGFRNVYWAYLLLALLAYVYLHRNKRASPSAG
ncbi:MFS transporter [Paenibacillus albicereus]|uniref:MFS transporter n=1 Tax=Paenibacillus albicereus TaxID=2726185 RepID=A0A6H2H4T5_9BACL|nr:MFS transporter [Paenibacillus albicereus]